VDPGAVTDAIRRVSGVKEVHDVHVWTITTGMDAMSAHVMVDRASDGSAILDELNRILSDRFGITHTTFQLEPH
jgi:cobalt-zinc-cadmium efflux system protein